MKVYKPAGNEDMFCVLSPVLHANVYGGKPPLAVRLIEPVEYPLQSGLAELEETIRFEKIHEPSSIFAFGL